jgi:hypothetical protein
VEAPEPQDDGALPFGGDADGPGDNQKYDDDDDRERDAHARLPEQCWFLIRVPIGVSVNVRACAIATG